MPHLQHLAAAHEAELLAFERANRSYFAASISDRGDEYFEHFAQRFNDELGVQQTGRDAYFVLVEDDGAIAGRVNLYEIDEGTANLGYRIAAHVAGQGVATAAVKELCALAASRYGLQLVRAFVSHHNVASQRVLAKAGFGRVADADVAGQPGYLYERRLASGIS